MHNEVKDLTVSGGGAGSLRNIALVGVVSLDKEHLNEWPFKTKHNAHDKTSSGTTSPVILHSLG